jgi:hypothetical protein
MRSATILAAWLAFVSASASADSPPHCDELAPDVTILAEHRGKSVPGLVRVALDGKDHDFDPEPVLRGRDVTQIVQENNSSQLIAAGSDASDRLTAVHVGDMLLLRIGDRTEAIPTVTRLGTGKLWVRGISFSRLNGVTLCDRLKDHPAKAH